MMVGTSNDSGKTLTIEGDVSASGDLFVDDITGQPRHLTMDDINN